MKDDDGSVAALRSVSLFAGLDDKALRRIATQAKPYSFQTGTSVIDADSSGRFGRLYAVVSGTAEAQVNGEQVATFGPGSYFGEMSVLDGRPRTATIIATSALATYGLSTWNMRALLHEEPEIALHIIDTLTARLRDLHQRADD